MISHLDSLALCLLLTQGKLLILAAGTCYVGVLYERSVLCLILLYIIIDISLPRGRIRFLVDRELFWMSTEPNTVPLNAAQSKHKSAY